MSAECPRTGRRSSLTVLALVILFAGPVLVAFWLNVAHPDWRPFGRTNHGTLVTPSYWVGTSDLLDSSAATAETEGYWILLHGVVESCDEPCQRLLIATRQVRLSLGKDAKRVVRVAVRAASDVPLDWSRLTELHPDLATRTVDPAWLRAAFSGPLADDARVVLIDPNGYAVLKYGVESTAKGLARDLARLLKISKIG